VRITREHVERYTNGDCAVLALELAKADPTWFIATTAAEDHAFVVNADRTEAIDVEGRRPLKDLLESWKGVLGYVAQDFESGRNTLEAEGWWIHEGANPTQAARLAQELLSQD
jgi:hypothetical protein